MHFETQQLSWRRRKKTWSVADNFLGRQHTTFWIVLDMCVLK